MIRGRDGDVWWSYGSREVKARWRTTAGGGSSGRLLIAPAAVLESREVGVWEAWLLFYEASNCVVMEDSRRSS